MYVCLVTVALDSRTASARELLRQVQANRIKKANPKMVLNVDVLGTAEPPVVNFEFVDGTKKDFQSQSFIANEMLSEIYMIANNLDIEYELAGKSVDD